MSFPFKNRPLSLQTPMIFIALGCLDPWGAGHPPWNPPAGWSSWAQGLAVNLQRSWKIPYMNPYDIWEIIGKHRWTSVKILKNTRKMDKHGGLVRWENHRSKRMIFPGGHFWSPEGNAKKMFVHAYSMILSVQGWSFTQTIRFFYSVPAWVGHFSDQRSYPSKNLA